MTARTPEAGEPQLTLVEEFLVAIGHGRLSVADASTWATARVQEGGADPAMQALARCHGTSGERQLHPWARTTSWGQLLPEPYTFKAPVVRAGRSTMGSCHCLLPHEYFASLAAKAPQVFEELFGTAGERAHFWEEMQRTAQEVQGGTRATAHRDWLRQHPCAWAPASRRVPMGTHGDGGTFHGGEKVMVVSWGGLCRRGSTLDTRLLFCVLKDSEQDHEGHATLYRAFQVMAWSFGALAAGTHPTHDEDGVPIARRTAQSVRPWLDSRWSQFLEGACLGRGVSFAVTGSSYGKL